jgi:phage shock protein C
MIFGLCGGIGEYFSVDSTLIRLLFVLLAFMGGTGLVAYLVMGIITPEAPAAEGEEGEKEPARHARANGRFIVGFAFVALGTLLIVRQFVPLHWIEARLLVPMLLVLLGIYLIFMKRK